MLIKIFGKTKKIIGGISSIHISTYLTSISILEGIGKKIGIKEPKDWGNISVSKMIENGGGSLLTSFNGSKVNVLKSVYPTESWDKSMFQRLKSVNQV